MMHERKYAYLRSMVLSWGAATVRLVRWGQVPRHSVVRSTCCRVTYIHIGLRTTTSSQEKTSLCLL